MGIGKMFLYAAAAPATVPAVNLYSAFNSAKQRNVMGVLANCAASWVMLTAGNHYIANPQANVADSMDKAFHPNAAQMASDAGVATKKWTSGAISAAGTGITFVSALVTGVASGVDDQVQANRTHPRPALNK